METQPNQIIIIERLDNNSPPTRRELEENVELAWQEYIKGQRVKQPDNRLSVNYEINLRRLLERYPIRIDAGLPVPSWKDN